MEGGEVVLKGFIEFLNENESLFFCVVVKV